MRVWLLSLLVIHQTVILNPAQAQARGGFDLKTTLSSFGPEPLKVSQFLDLVRGQISPDYLSFLEAKSKSHKLHSLQISWLDRNHFVIEVLGQKTQVKVLDFKDHQFQINGKTVVLNPKHHPDRLIAELEKILQPSRKTSWLEIALGEKAHAFNMVTMLVGLLVVGLIGYMYNQSNCSQYDSYAAQCDSALRGGGGNVADLYYNARTFDDSWFNLSLGCSESKAKVQSCIPSLGSKINSGSTALTVQ